MNKLHIDVDRARRSVDQLIDLIHIQRHAVETGRLTRMELSDQLRELEDALVELQEQAVLERSERLNLLYEVSQTLNASLDWEETVETVIDAVIGVTGAERGMLVLLQDGRLKISVTRNATDQPFSERDLRFSQSVVRQALDRGKPLLTSNAQVDPRFQGSESIIAYGLRSILCAPLICQGEPLGVIYVENRAQAGVFTQDDLSVLAAFTNQAAIALANAHLHYQTDQALAKRVDELTLLQEMARDLNGRLDFDHVMKRSVVWAVTASDAEVGGIGLLSRTGVRWEAQEGDIAPDAKTVRRALTRRTVEWSPREMYLPLLRERRPVGILYLRAAEERSFSKETLQFVERLASNVAIAVENVRLYEALQETNQTKSEFVSLVSHELRTPMTSIRGYSEMLSKGIVGELNPRQQQFVEVILRNVGRMRVLVNDLLDLSRIEAGRLRLEPEAVSLEEAVEGAYETLGDQLQEKKQRFVAELPEQLPKVFADPDRLTQILINLMSNAVKYTPEGGRVVVRSEATAVEQGMIHCAVRDTGVGISQEDQKQLFTKFFRSEDPEVREQPGTGLGLAITKSLVELHGGDIWVRSRKGRGTTVAFTLPVANGAGH
jgi:signal transduction histidine kinase